MKNSQSNQKTYPNGITLSGPLFWIGALLAGFSVYKMVEGMEIDGNQLYAIPLLLGLILIFSGEGNILDFQNKKLILYHSFLSFKYLYRTVDITDFKQVDLVLFSENQTYRSANRVPNSTTIRTRVYELRLKNDSENHLVSETTDYEKAKLMLNEISEGLNIEGINQYQAWRERMVSRRRR